MTNIHEELLSTASWLKYEASKAKVFAPAEDWDGDGDTLFFELVDGKLLILNAKETEEGADIFPAW